MASNWRSAPLREVIEGALRPFRQNAERVTLSGPDLALGPKATSSLSMAMHELATNAAKYGALSTGSGGISVSWQVEPDGAPQLLLRWEESGGPVVHLPSRRGFGSRMIDRTVAGELGGSVELTYRAEGVVCVARASLAMLAV